MKSEFIDIFGAVLKFYYSLHRETTTVSTPENEVEKKVDVVDEDSKASENGDVEKPKENGTTEEKDSAEDSKDKEVESAENGDSTGTFYFCIHFLRSRMYVYTYYNTIWQNSRIIPACNL